MKWPRFRTYFLIAALSGALGALSARAETDTSSLDPTQIQNALNEAAANAVPAGTIDAIVKSFALATDHRAYEGAAPLTRSGFSLGIEASLVKAPNDLSTALSKIGGGDGATKIPFIPVPRINVHKGLSDRFDIGGAYIGYRGFRILSGEAKLVILQPEEGPTWAFRVSYTTTTLTVNQKFAISLTSKTITPQLLASKNFDYAESYIGIGFQSTSGSAKVTVPINQNGLVGTVTVPADAGRDGAFMAFTGVTLRLPFTGIKLVLEGSYNTAGANYMGTKIAFGF